MRELGHVVIVELGHVVGTDARIGSYSGWVICWDLRVELGDALGADGGSGPCGGII